MHVDLKPRCDRVRLVPTSGNNIHSVMKSRTAEHFRKYKIPFFNSIPEEKYILL